MLKVKTSLLGSLPVKVMSLAVAPVTSTDCALAVGTWLAMVRVTVAGLLSVSPSLTVKVKLSGPL